MSDRHRDASELAALRQECLGMGFIEGMDFHIEGFPTPLSSEHIELLVEDDGFEVRYSDMGRHRLVAKASTVAGIKDVFVEQVTELAAGRDRGPRAGQTREVRSWRDTMSDDELVAKYLREQQSK